MNVNLIPCLSDNYSYFIIDPDSKKTCVVDPAEFGALDNFITKNKLTVDYILNTHHHADHVDGNLQLKEKYKCKIVGFEKDKSRIPGIDITLKDQETWMFGNEEIKIHHVPGHTMGHIFFHFTKSKIAFVGDTLFSLGCGRVFEGSYEEMFHSVTKVKKLPAETIIYCGHEYTASNAKFCIAYDPSNKTLEKRVDEIKTLRSKNLPTIPTTIKNEIDTNIFLRCDNREIRKNLSLENSSDIEVFIKLRKLKDNF